MVSHRVAGAPLDFAALRSELAVPGDFADAVLAEARAAAESIELPDADATDIPLITIDPADSKDLDQAVRIERDGSGYLVIYAIADVASFVAPGSLLDLEAQRRGQTLYFPDARVPLYPPVLSEDAASLLAGEVRPAVVWRIRLDEHAQPTRVDLARERVRSRAQLDYVGVQRDLDSSVPSDEVSLLAEVGRKRLQLARARHAINLDLPEQEVENDGSGWQLAIRRPLPVEGYNAEISLLTGMCAAQLMLAHECGILRTIPEPDPGALASLRRAALVLGISWPHGAHPGDVLAGLDRGNPRHVVLIEHATSLLRGAGYTSFDGAPPAVCTHAGIGAPYAHVTAPLRRLVDRYTTEICLALSADGTVSQWVRDRMSTLPSVMAASEHNEHVIDRAVVDATEAWLLRDRVGDAFSALVIDADDHAGTITLDNPPVRARCSGAGLPVGERINAVLVEADVAMRAVRFARQ